MIRVELLGRQRRWSLWSKALLAVLVVCGGLYGSHRHFPALAGSLFSAGSAFIPAMQQEAKPSPVVQQEAQQDTVPSTAVVQREITPDLVASRPRPISWHSKTPSQAPPYNKRSLLSL